MHSLRRRLKESIWAFKKSIVGQLKFWRHIINTETMKEKEHFFLFAPFAMLCISCWLRGGFFGVIYPRIFYLRIVYL